MSVRTRGLVCGVVALLACSALAQPALANEPAPAAKRRDELPRGLRSGPVIAAGLGNQFAGLGAQLGYYVRLGESEFAIAPYAGAGVRSFGDGYDSVVSGTAGVMAMLGGENRWLLDAGFGGVDAVALSLHGAPVATRALHGVTLALGREWMGGLGLAFRVLLGASYAVDAGAIDPFGVALSLGVGWKLW